MICRVCGKVEYVAKTDDDDFVCSVCCDLNITDKEELQDALFKINESICEWEADGDILDKELVYNIRDALGR